MIKTLINAFKNKEVRTKILITLLLLLVYRVGCWLPIPGIGGAVQNTVSSGDTLLTLLSSITGGALSQGAFLAIGISPYINSSIIIQLLTVAIPALERLSKQGGEGRKKINKITRFATLILAIAQSVAITISWANTDALETEIFTGIFAQEWMIGILVTVMLIAGSMFTLWLGEIITEKGVGNGISLLIFVGILSSAGIAILDKFRDFFINSNDVAIWELLGFFLMVVLVFGLIVFVDLAERRIPIQYAKQIKGRKQYGGQSTFIPLKVNASGVLPIIFSTAIITFPQVICQMVSADPSKGFYAWYIKWIGTGTPIYTVLVGLLILFFCYFYAQMQFNPEEIARNIQQYGGFIPGIRPGKPTYEYLEKISKRITLFGAIYLAFIAIVPSFVFSLVLPESVSLVNSMSATGMLIVVSVALEFNKQLESLMMMKQYKGFIK